ncbi:cyclic nucleotide-binding domain-containing protein [Bdellovibrionota bacterium FG-1]
MSRPNLSTFSLKAGEVFLKPGDKIKSVYLIQAGRLSICQARPGKMIEVAQLRAPEMLGEEQVFGASPWQLTALAIRDTVIVEIPLQMIQAELNHESPRNKLILKGISERSKAVFNEFRALQNSREVLPCPHECTAKAFGAVFHAAHAVGQKKGAIIEAEWNELKKFAIEVFEEPVVRLEDVVKILAKLGFVTFDGRVIELGLLNQLEGFFDFYGNYFFKGGHAELLKTNAKMQKMTEELLSLEKQFPADRAGFAHLPYSLTMDALKVAIGVTFDPNQLFRLEQKGLFLKRQNIEGGTVLSFYKPDFEQMLWNWNILREVELWNERGYVDGEGLKIPLDAPANPESERKRWAQILADWKPLAPIQGVPALRLGEKSVDEIWCHVCMSVVQKDQKFCEICGTGLTTQVA